MAHQTIPITLQAGPVPLPYEAADINQLLETVAKYLSGSIRADVSFYLEVFVDPTNFVTNLIFNSAQRVFKAWNPATGTYVPLTTFTAGDIKTSLVGTDQVALGWVLLDGRAITAITGLTTAQQTVLETFFGIGGNLPTVSAQNIQNLPADGSFENLPIDGTYTQAEIEALRDKSEELLDALNNTNSPPLYSLMFIGQS
jgi:hypothetical protein